MRAFVRIYLWFLLFCFVIKFLLLFWIVFQNRIKTIFTTTCMHHRKNRINKKCTHTDRETVGRQRCYNEFYLACGVHNYLLSSQNYNRKIACAVHVISVLMLMILLTHTFTHSCLFIFRYSQIFM